MTDSNRAEIGSLFERCTERLEGRLEELPASGEPAITVHAVALFEQMNFFHESLGDHGDPEGRTAKITRLGRELRETLSTDESSATAVVADAIERRCERLPKSVGIVLTLDPISNETNNALAPRDSIAFARRFLPSGALSERTIGRIEGLDAVLYTKYQKEASKYEDQLRSTAEHHYPEELWWRHPEQFFSGEQPRVRLWHQRDSTGSTEHQAISRALRSLVTTDTVVLQHDPLDTETERALQMRDQVEIELRRVPANTVDRRTLGRLDAVDALLYDKLKLVIELERWEDLSRISQPDLPQSFWWRHPKQFLAETDDPVVDIWHSRYSL